MSGNYTKNLERRTTIYPVAMHRNVSPRSYITHLLSDNRPIPEVILELRYPKSPGLKRGP